VNKKVSPLRATACFPSPIGTDFHLPRSFASATYGSHHSSGSPFKRNDPFLMFRDLTHGWHSNPMGVTYLPLPPFREPNGSSSILVTDVNAMKLLTLTAIRYHEDPGHAIQLSYR
jgi:hypothetical protein